MKLELKHIAPYLPYDVKFKQIDKASFLCDPDIVNIKTVDFRNAEILLIKKRYKFVSAKLILRPLRDLDEVNPDCDFGQEYCSEVGYVPSDVRTLSAPDMQHLSYWKIKKLLSWHFDIFNLIEAGLAIDINTLKD